ncbi:MAG TPA: IPTL-CTERM sorting domain-containing protein [Candidatus Polarisedimenticolia bacterium]|jgi:hypothetical protein
MKRHTGSTGAKQAMALIVCAILMAGISGLPAGSGNLGRDEGINPAGPQVDVVIGSTVFSETILTGDFTSTLRNRLAIQIDNDPNFSADPPPTFTDPFDPNAVAFEVKTQSGQEIQDMQICETAPKIEQIAVNFLAGVDFARFRKATTVTGVNSDPNTHPGLPNYTLTIRTLPPLFLDPVYTLSYTTSAPPNNTATGLNNSIRADLLAAGFTVTEDSTNFTIRKIGEPIISVKTSTTDSGITQLCVSLSPFDPNIPTLSQVGMFVLVLILTGSAIMMLRRKGSTPQGARK